MRSKNHRMQLRNLVVILISLTLAITLTLPSNVLSKGSPVTHMVSVGGDLPHAGGESMYMGFNPSLIVINAGDTVVWKALDGPHTVTSEEVTADGTLLFDSNPKVSFPLPALIFGPGWFIPPGGKYILDTSTLSPGTYAFLCSIHADSGMNGTLTITSDTAPAGSQFTVVTGVSSGTTEVEQFIPNDITVAKGTQVIFANLSGFEVHTVVSVVTLPSGKQVLGTLFDSSPNIAPPGTTVDQLPQVNLEGVNSLGGAMLPIPGMDTFSYTFNNPGTYLYYCKYHAAVENGNIAGMVGEVIVQPSNEMGSAQQQIANAITVGIAGIVLGLIGIIIALLALMKSRIGSKP